MFKHKHIEYFFDDPTNFTPPEYTKQRHQFQGKIWDVKGLVEIAKTLPVFEKPLSEIRAIALNAAFPNANKMSYIEFAYHCKVAMEADLDFPIILSEDGRLMDGQHRLLKALITGEHSIKVVQFVMDPMPDEYTDNFLEE